MFYKWTHLSSVICHLPLCDITLWLCVCRCAPWRQPTGRWNCRSESTMKRELLVSPKTTAPTSPPSLTFELRHCSHYSRHDTKLFCNRKTNRHSQQLHPQNFNVGGQTRSQKILVWHTKNKSHNLISGI